MSRFLQTRGRPKGQRRLPLLSILTLLVATIGSMGVWIDTSVASAAGTTTNATVRFDFEDGTTQGWGTAWGNGVAVTNTTYRAYTGRHSLAVKLSATVGYPAIGQTTALAGMTPGSGVTYHVYAPNTSTVAITPFVDDSAWNETFGTTTTLVKGWNTLTFTIPADLTDVKRVGLEIENDAGWGGVLDVDAVATTASNAGGAPTTTSTSAASASSSSATKVSTTSTTISARTTTISTTSSTSMATAATSSSTGETTGPTYYVSRSGNNSDGQSWATAWNELDQVQWSELGPGATLVIDGGSTACPSNYDFSNHAVNRPGLQCGMLYTTPLTVGASGSSTSPITIQLATTPGRNGTAVFFGGRASALPYCDQQGYTQQGTPNSAGISIIGQHNIVVDGEHRSGMMIYGALTGVSLRSDSTSFVTLRNLEIFDNGVAETWSYGWKSDNPGIWLDGHDITIDRDLIHDNGQDEIQDGYTGPINNGSHAALSNIVVENSWLYVHRDHPLWPGYGFNAGSQEVASQNCTHVDGIQIWGGGLHQQGLTIQHDVFGPLIAQGVYPGDQDAASFDHVTISDTLFLDPSEHSIIGDSIASDPSTPGTWVIDHVTSFLTNPPVTGTGSNGKVDLAGSGHALTNSIFQNGYFYTASALADASGNIWSGGDPVPGASNVSPQFVGPLPTTNTPSYAQLVSINFTPQCTGCAGKGASLHSVQDLLNLMDAENASAP